MSIQFPLYIGTTINSGDVYYNEDALLLHADGVTGATNNYIVDASTNTFAITRVGTPAQGSVNPFGTNWSAYFNGSVTATVYVSTVTTSSFAFGSNNFTIEAWINGANTVSNYPLIIGNYATTFTTNAWGLFFNRIDNGGSFVFNAFNGSLFAGSNSPYVVNGWNHVAVVRNGNFINIFVNGTQTSSNAYAVSLDGGAAARLYIGDAGGTDATTRYNGYISNLRVVNGSAVYTGTFTPSVVPLSTVTNTVLLTLASNYVRDLSTLNFATTASSGVSIQRFNPFGNTQTYAISSDTVWGSTYFGGSGNYMTTNSTPISTTQSTFTIEAWIYMTATPVGSDRGAVVGDMQANAGSNIWSFGPNASGQLTFYWYTGSLNTAYGNTILNLNTWYHIAVSINAAAISMYVNGVQQTLTGTTTLTNRLGSNNSLAIGQYSNTPAALFTGYISNLRIVNSTAVYSATFTPSPVPLLSLIHI